MQTVHTILADATVLAVGGALVWSLILAIKVESGGRLYDRLQALVVALVVLAAAAGATLLRLANGHRTDCMSYTAGSRSS